jgi:hypothetical protein
MNQRKRWECKLQSVSRAKLVDGAQTGRGDIALRNRREDLIVQDDG